MIHLQERAKTLFLQAMAIASEEERAAYLREQCSANDDLRREVEDLLKHHGELGAFLESPAANLAATVEQSIGEGPGTVIGPYTLQQQIGEGGMGVVYLAEQTEPVRRQVALKIIKPGMDSKQVIARFEAERQALALMDHPHIAKVLDAGMTDGGRPYFVMELVKGRSITRYCDEHRLTLRERLELFIPICQAVQHAHQKGIIHRDLKPSNVLITLYDDRPVPKVIDFGVAKATGGRLTDRTLFTEQNSIVGTFEYMSPEQAGLNDLDIDTRSDIYSLGVLLYELLTGTTPLEPRRIREVALLELLRSIREDETPPPSQRLSTIEDLPVVAAARGIEPRKLSTLMRGELDWVVTKMLEKDRSRRYETAATLAADVQRYLNNEPVEACPPSAWYRLKKFIGRHKGVLLTTAAVLIALLAGTAVAAWQAVRATDERDRAEIAKDRAVTAEQQARLESKLARRAEGEARENERTARRHLHTARVHLAEQQLQRGHWGQALTLLQADRPRPGQKDLRGFAWHHLWWRTRERLVATLHGHEDWTGALAYSSDGKFLASGSSDGTVKLWNPASGETIRTLDGHKTAVLDIALSPDDKLLASAAIDGNVIVWTVAHGKELLRLKNHGGAVRAVAFSPDGRLLASQDERSGTVRLWEPSTGKLQATLACGRGTWCRFLRFSPDGRILATGKGSERVALWDVASGQIQLSRRRPLGLNDAAFTPDGKVLVTVGGDRQIIFWDVQTGKAITRWFTDVGRLRSVSFSPDGRIVAIGFGEGTVMLLDLESGRKRYYAHVGPIDALAFSPDGQVLASGGQDGSIKLWRTDWVPPRSPAKPRVNPAWALAFSPDGKILASAAPNGVRLRDAATGEVRAELKSHGNGLAFSPDGKRLACAAGNTERVRVWGLSGEEAPRLLLAHSTAARRHNPAYAVAFSPEGDVLAAGTKNGTITLWDTNTWQQLAPIQAGNMWVWSLQFSPDGKELAVGGNNGSKYDVAVWNWPERKLITTIQGASGPAVFSPDGTLLACQANTRKSFGRIILRHVKSRKTRLIGKRTSNLPASRSRIAFFPDGQTLARVGRGEVTLWDVATGEERPMFQELPHWAHSLAISPDGKTLATGGSFGTVSLWRTDGEGSTAEKPNHELPPGGSAQVAAYAVRLATRAVQEKPKALAVYQKRAAAYTRLGQPEKAAQDLTTVLALLPATDHAQRIRILIRLGQYEKAAAEFVLAHEHAAEPTWNYQSRLFRQLMACDDRVFGHLAEWRANEPRLYLAAGRYFAQRGQWKKAAEHYARARILDSLPLSGPGIEYAYVLLLSGDDEGYAHYCRELLRRFGASEDGQKTYYLARICALPLSSTVDPAQLLRWAEAAVQHRRDKFTLLVLAAACYRGDQEERTLALVGEALAAHGGHQSNVAFLLALAYHRLGHHEASRRWYDHGRNTLERMTPKDPDEPCGWALSHWLNANLWYGEAKGVFEPGEDARSDRAEKVQPESTLTLLENLVREYPESAAAHYALGVALYATSVQGSDGKLPSFEQGDVEPLGRAFLHVETAVDLDPGNAQYARWLEWSRESTFLFWQEAVEAHPESLTARYELASACVLLHRWQEAIRHLRAAQPMQPEPGRVNRLLATLLVDCPEPSLREPAQGLALARTYARKPLDLRLLGLAEFRNGNWQQAEVALSGHVERSTNPNVQRHGLAMANWKLGKKDKAFDWLLQGMSTPPTSDAVERYHHEAVNLIPAEEIIAECTRRLEDGELLPCYLARGEAHVRLKQTEAAVSDFVKAMELQRARGGEVGMIYRRLAAFPEVVEAVATLRPKDRTLWLEVARYHGLFWRWDQMAEAYRNYVELTPASGLNAGLLRDLALASLLAGDEDGYRRTCQRMAERWGETQSPGHLQVLASTCVANEQSPVADARVLQWAEKAVRGMPHSAEVHRTAGLGYYRLGQLHKAIACFEKANLLDGGPHSATAFCLALAHQRLGNPRESRRYYDFAVALHQSRRPDPPDVPSRARDLGYLLQCELLSRQARALLEGR